MSIGSAKPHDYVIQECIRRVLGRQLRRQDQSNAIPGIDDLTAWHHSKAPFIRMVSNAVPHSEAKKFAEYTVAQEVFKEDPTETTRFRHILWGGVGQFVPEKPDGIGEDDKPIPAGIKLAHSWEEMYVNPFQSGEAPHGSLKNQHAPEINYRPMPGITGMNVTYKGAMGALKKAVIRFKCYNLSDLERLEKLYMFPGMKVLVEWGWSINTAGEGRKSKPITLLPLDDEVLASPASVYNHIQAARFQSGGCYDGLFGTVTNFSWTINEDLSFDCTTNISDIGDSIFTVNVNTPFHTKKSDEEKKKADEYTLHAALKDINKQLGSSGKYNAVNDITLTLPQIGAFTCKYYRIEIGTPSKGGSSSNKTHKKKQLYIRFGDIVDRLCNKLYCLTSKHTRTDQAAGGTISPAISMFSIGGTNDDQNAGLSAAEIKTVVNPETKDEKEPTQIMERPISVISNHKYLCSCDPEVCLLPNQIGEAPYEVVKVGKGVYGSSKYVPTGLKGGGVDFNVPQAAADKLFTPAGSYKREANNGAGFLANIFVNMDLILNQAEQANSLADFLDGISLEVNNACGNIWAFQWRMLDTHPGYMTCVDQNFSWTGDIYALELAVDNLSSIIKSLSMKSAISSQMVNALYIAGNSPFTGETVKKGELANKNIIPLDIDFEIDGLSGIQFGTNFAIDYLPKRYRAQCYLFAKQVAHNIDNGTWGTSITAGFRWAPQDDSLAKIRLKMIPFLQSKITGTDLEIQTAITEETPDKGKGMGQARVNEGPQLIPGNIFQDLSSQELVIGGDGQDPATGMEVNDFVEKQQDFIELVDEYNEILAKIYNGGGSDEDVNEANAILTKIINYSDEDVAQAEEAKALEDANKPPTKTKVTRTRKSPPPPPPPTIEITPVIDYSLFEKFRPIAMPDQTTFYIEPSYDPSDIRLKENISLVGKSESGIPIYEFTFKDKTDGIGRYRGVIAQDVPWATKERGDGSGYLDVDYSLLDVDFVRM